MSTGKIAKQFNPKKASNPNFGNIEKKTEQKVDKLQQALDTFIDGIDEIESLIKEQNSSIEQIFNKLYSIEQRVLKLEQNTDKNSAELKVKCNNISEQVQDCKKTLVENEEKRSKSWFFR